MPWGHSATSQTPKGRRWSQNPIQRLRRCKRSYSLGNNYVRDDQTPLNVTFMEWIAWRSSKQLCYQKKKKKNTANKGSRKEKRQWKWTRIILNVIFFLLIIIQNKNECQWEQPVNMPYEATKDTNKKQHIATHLSFPWPRTFHKWVNV